jgi:hypothetical protein
VDKKRSWKEWLGFDSAEESSSEESGSRSDRVRISAVVAVALVAGLLVWLLIAAGGDDSDPATTAETAASKTVEVVSESDLLGALEGVGYPVYWAGSRPGVDYEVSRLEEGRTYIRYLPEGEEAESEEQFLTVGSYQQVDAIESIRELGSKPGALLVQIDGGGSAYAEGVDATSAYMAFPGVEAQVEVFDPEPGKALQLIRSGTIVPVG